MYQPKYQEEYDREYDREYARLNVRKEAEASDKQKKDEKARRQTLIQSIFFMACLIIGYLILKGFM